MNTLPLEEHLECPTPLSAVLLRLYVVENNVNILELEKLVAWWIEKIKIPAEADNWIDTKLWRLCAQHIHALFVVNAADAADAMAPFLGIEAELKSRPEIRFDERGKIFVEWVDIPPTDPPYGFVAWEKALTVQA